MLALLIPASAWSQSDPVDSVPAPSSDFVIKEDAVVTGATKTAGAAGADTLSVDFPDEDIRNILRNVADLFEINLVVPDTLQGRTSIKLRDVTWRQIFQVTLSPVGFTYIEEGNIIKIVSNESLAAEPLSTEVFIINYAPAGELKPALDPLANSPGGGIRVDVRSNALIITERPTQINKIRPIIEQLDKATAQVMIESKFVEVTNADVRNIGVNWTSLSGMQVGAGGLNQEWNRERGQNRTTGRDGSSGSSSTQGTTGSSSTSVSNTTGTTGGTTSGSTTTNTGGVTTSDTTTSVGDLLTFNPITNLPTVTAIPPVSNTTTNITQPSSQTTTTSGVNSGTNTANSNTVTDSLGSTLSSTASNAVNNLFGLTNTGGTNRLASAVFSASDFNVILSALKTTNDTKLVSNPTVVTLNNSEATINIGQEFPIPNYTYNQERGTYEVSGFEYKPLGIILKVTPQVNAQGFIKLTVEPEVSSSSESASFGGAQIPIVVTRKTKTQVSLKDGFTMGIGGLIENRVTKGQTRVPVLGDIPVLGRLFRSDSTNDTMRNLIIFITAKTVSPDGAPIEEIFDSRAVRQMQMRRDELPGYRDGSDPFLPHAVQPTKRM
ncbi:MAG TPA: secretin N-terminal domain-containing protein [Opitutaceae bacterium]|nr:secretin N-terminal domain-containing protein [Opitutaceae bacterium]HRJ46028.1 secretin N-terminal domain-containing protein [Opitutaceae bacterium]